MDWRLQISLRPGSVRCGSAVDWFEPSCGDNHHCWCVRLWNWRNTECRVEPRKQYLKLSSRDLIATGQIQKDGLALIFPIQKFHLCIYDVDSNSLHITNNFCAFWTKEYSASIHGKSTATVETDTTVMWPPISEHEFEQAVVLSRLVPQRATQTDGIVEKTEQYMLAVQSATVKASHMTRKDTEEESRKHEKTYQAIRLKP